MNTRVVLTQILVRHPRRLRVLVGCLCVLIAIPTVSMLLLTPQQVAGSDFRLAVPLFPMGVVAIIWLMLTTSAAPLWYEARAQLLPSFTRPFARAMALLGAATIVVPAIVLGARWSGIPLTLAQLTAAACIGVLLPMWALALPPRVWARISLCCWLAWGVIYVVGRWFHPTIQQPAFLADLDWRPHWTLEWVVLAGLLASAMAWTLTRRRRKFLRPDSVGNVYSQPITRLFSPEVLRQFSPQATDPSAAQLQLPKWLGPPAPVLAMRFLLGGFFVPAGFRRRLLRSLAFVPILLLVLTALSHNTNLSTHRPAALTLLVVLQIFSFSEASRRLRQLFDKLQGDLVELALLPGWGGAAGARHLLLSTLWTTLSLHLIACLPLALVLAWWVSGSPAYLLFTALILFGAGLIQAALCLRMLAALGNSRDDGWVTGFYVSIGLPGGIAGAILGCVPNSWLDAEVLTLLAVWMACCVVAAMVGWHAWRALCRRPHPFLLGLPS